MELASKGPDSSLLVHEELSPYVTCHLTVNLSKEVFLDVGSRACVDSEVVIIAIIQDLS